jgi:3-hydroxyisobutyrate dehydrogenase-like beta-hydroxyacid dehydrogenase
MAEPRDNRSLRAPVGVVGLGLLGGAVVERLRTAGFHVLGYDRSAARAAALGVGGAGTAAELASRVHRVVLCLPDSDAVEEVVEGRAGLQEAWATAWRGSGAGGGSGLLVDCTTGDPRRSQALAERLSADGVHYVEAAVSGSSAVLRRGDAVLLVAGNRAAVEAAADLLDALAGVVFDLGDVGSAGRMKLAVNLVLGLNRLALAEGLALAEKAGLSPGAFLEVVRAGPAHSRVLEAKGEKMRRGDFAPEARLAQHLKDVRLILALGDEVGAALPATRLHADLLERALARGLGEADNSAIVEVLRRMPREPPTAEGTTGLAPQSPPQGPERRFREG